MSDFLLENSGARRLIQALGLPIPLPRKLSRAEGPLGERPLDHRVIALGGAMSPLSSPVALVLASAGADPYAVTNPELNAAFAEPGEAYGRPVKQIDPSALDEAFTAYALLFDASTLTDPEGLSQLYEFFHPLIRRVEDCGRIVILARPPAGARTPDEAAAQSAVHGFARSLAKEVGKRGVTVQVLSVGRGAEDRIPGPLLFLLSPHAAFVTGQVIELSTRVVPPPQVTWVRSLEGRIALVTGAARGIGAATAKRLAAEGAHVVCLDRPADELAVRQIAREVGGSPLAVDIAERSAPDAIRRHLRENHEGVDIVVHNAGVTRDRTLAKMERDEWGNVLAVNLGAVARVTRALLDGVLRDQGRVVCMSSVTGIAGNMGQTNYSASKAGLIGFVGRLGDLLAPRGIAVNAVAPGFIETRMTQSIPPFVREVGRRLSAMGQGGSPNDVAEVVTFLSSPGASGITGSVVRVCGGAFMGA